MSDTACDISSDISSGECCSASEMTYIVSGGELNFTHSLVNAARSNRLSFNILTGVLSCHEI